MSLDLKVWFRAQMVPFMKAIKAELQQNANIMGQLAGLSNTFSGLPTTDADGSPLESGDWAILTALDNTYVPGIYVFDGTDWGFAMAMASFQDMLDGILATDAEFATGTATDKAPTVKQVNDTFSKLAGSATQTHACAAAAVGSTDAVNASQFNSVPISDAEALSDWNAA